MSTRSRCRFLSILSRKRSRALLNQSAISSNAATQSAATPSAAAPSATVQGLHAVARREMGLRPPRVVRLSAPLRHAIVGRSAAVRRATMGRNAAAVRRATRRSPAESAVTEGRCPCQVTSTMRIPAATASTPQAARHVPMLRSQVPLFAAARHAPFPCSAENNRATKSLRRFNVEGSNFCLIQSVTTRRQLGFCRFACPCTGVGRKARWSRRCSANPSGLRRLLRSRTWCRRCEEWLHTRFAHGFSP